MAHILIGCAFSKTIWFEVLSWIRLTMTPPMGEGDFADWWLLVIRSTPRSFEREPRRWSCQRPGGSGNTRTQPSSTMCAPRCPLYWTLLRRKPGRQREPEDLSSFFPRLVLGWVVWRGVGPLPELYKKPSFFLSTHQNTKSFAFSHKKC
jgi:hypothetical protein